MQKVILAHRCERYEAIGVRKEERGRHKARGHIGHKARKIREHLWHEERGAIGHAGHETRET